jgi:hypothetical protein
MRLSLRTMDVELVPMPFLPLAVVICDPPAASDDERESNGRASVQNARSFLPFRGFCKVLSEA